MLYKQYGSLNSNLNILKSKKITVTLKTPGTFTTGLNTKEHIIVDCVCHSSDTGYYVMPLYVKGTAIYAMIVDVKLNIIKEGTHDIVIYYYDNNV